MALETEHLRVLRQHLSHDTSTVLTTLAHEAAVTSSDHDLTSNQPYMTAALIIPKEFFDEASIESRNVVPPPVVRDDHLFAFREPGASAKHSWRRLLQSPLGSFLSGVRQRYPFIQLAGHKGDFISGQGGIIYKKSSVLEKAALESLMSDVLKPMVPLYFKAVQIEDSQGSKAEYLEMQDLLGNFTDPSVMDIKLGVRTFLESEVIKTTRRPDLLQKMMKLDPDEPTEEEKEHGITKLRYMMFRERLSSTNTLGLRVEAVKKAHEPPRNDFQRVKLRSEVFRVIESFFPPRDTEPELHDRVKRRILDRLEAMRDKLPVSSFFKCHELIGSSLLFIYDSTGKAGVWMIDFGKTSRVDKEIHHDLPWKLGSQEDGYLIGLDNIITMIGDC
ncbi:uncharacterized protein MONBRDRAFT_24063 [Monosiga brevicollis MX1]|uniref:Kinase n=1 Tax=Monosiga brevicollis TaxID=81824 RepID=A9UUL0_MONBE|nr:uncharacterized protein MONBRDRAFT_24063 [Monosiga brevicollis MX1]EDQ91117.1 predicted protein [Monosiga brevicollis MX1]|eukprot:XP_001744414.1 hypothetical protein [Monosiga brevicollis MX1]